MNLKITLRKEKAYWRKLGKNIKTLPKINKNNYKTLDCYWTSKKPIKGLSHFVLVDKFHLGDEITFLLVSVLDADIYLKVSEEEIMNKEIWNEGWLNLSKKNSISTEYLKYKSKQKAADENNKIFLSKHSHFYIS